MDKLWQIFPGKGSKEKKKATKLGCVFVKKWTQCQWQTSKAHVCLSSASFHAQGGSGSSLLTLMGEVMLLSSEVVVVSCLLQRLISDTPVKNDTTSVYIVFLFPFFPLSIYRFLHFSPTPTSFMYPGCFSLFSSIVYSLPPSLAASTLLPFSSLFSRGGGYG